MPVDDSARSGLDPSATATGSFTAKVPTFCSTPAFNWLVTVEKNCCCSAGARKPVFALRSEEHTSELQSLMRISYAVFCLKKKKKQNTHTILKLHVTLLTRPK